MLDMTRVEFTPTPAQSRFAYSAELLVHEYSPTETTLFQGISVSYWKDSILVFRNSPVPTTASCSVIGFNSPTL